MLNASNGSLTIAILDEDANTHTVVVESHNVAPLATLRADGIDYSLSVSLANGVYTAATDLPTLISGTAADDAIVGGGESDILFGNAGDDEITGGGGDDTIVVSDGDDVVTYGDGVDRVVIRADYQIKNTGSVSGGLKLNLTKVADGPIIVLHLRVTAASVRRLVSGFTRMKLNLMIFWCRRLVILPSTR